MPRSDHHHPEYPVLDLSKDVEDKRAKREIANMNERRRMQNINSGFHSLRALLPHKHDGEKLSKAAILQHTATYIYQLEQEISKLLSQNSELKRALGGTAMSQVSTNTPEWIKRFASEPPDCPSCKRRKFDDSNRHMDLSPMGTGEGGSSTESSSEQEVNAKFRARKQNGSNGKNGSGVDQSLRKQLIRVEKELEEERRLRRMLEEELGYQSKSVSQNGRTGNHHYSGLDTTIVADEVEVASESIEIEMHSCPASPPDALALPPIEQSVPPSTVSTVYMANQHRTSVISSSSLEMNHKMLEQQQRAAKQNAIALPIDVPFVAPREVVVTETDESKPQVVQTTTANGGQMVLLLDKGGQIMSILDPSAIQTTSSGSSSATPQIIHLVSSTGDGNSSSVSSSNGNLNPNPKTSSVVVMSSSQQDDSIITTANSVPTMSSTQKQALLEEPPESAQTSRQNLNTIVEAIRHLEGDHLFESTSKQLAKQNHLFFH